MSRPTFFAARSALLKGLADLGWSVSSPSLKVPHATSPHGTLRLWFKPQAVHYTAGARHVFGDARCISYDLDIRDPDVTAVSLAAVAQLRASRDAGF